MAALALAAIAGAGGAEPATAGEAPAASKLTAKEWFAKGRAHHKLGEYVKAIEAYENANAIEPHPVYLYNVALAYEALGDGASALRYYERYLEAGPDSALADVVKARVAELRKRVAPPRPRPAPAETASPPASVSTASPATAATPAPPAAAGLTAPARASDAGTRRPKGRGLALGLGLGLGGGALAVGTAILLVVLLARPSLPDRLAASWDGPVVDFRGGP